MHSKITSSRRTAIRFGGLLAGLTVSALAIAGCAASDSQVNPQDLDTTITYLTSRPAEQTQVILDAFAKKHPNIDVKVQRYPFKQFLQQAEILLGQGGEGVDVVDVDGPLVASYGVRGYLTPLDDLLGKDFIRDTYLKGPLKNGYFNKNLIAAPMQGGGLLTFLNLDLFKKAGVEPPPGLRGVDTPDDASLATLSDSTWTWEQVVEAAKKIKAATGKYGLLINQPDVTFQMLPFADSLQQPALSPDGLTADGYLNTKPWERVGQFWYDLSNTWGIHPKGIDTDETLPFFQAGNAAMFVAGVQYMDQLGPMFKAGKFNLDVTAHPYFAGGIHVNTRGSWGMGVAAHSKHKAAAAEFIRFYTGPEGSKLWTEITGRPATMAASEAQKTDPANQEFPGDAKLFAVYESEKYGISRPFSPGYLEFDSVMTRTFADIRNGADPAATIKKATVQIDRQLKKYGSKG